jgi:hypothetical protein
MNFNPAWLRFAAFSVMTCASTSWTHGQGEGWWRGIFKPKSEPINVHAPATPTEATGAPADSSDQGTTAFPHSPNGSQLDEVSTPATTTTGPEKSPNDEIIELPPGAFVIQQPAQLDSLDSIWRLNPPAVNGFRIQVFLGDLNAARAERARLRRITEEPVYLQAMPPSYGLMVGDFHDKWAAERLRLSWSELYPDALTIPTDINPIRLPEKAKDGALTPQESILTSGSIPSKD